MSEPIELHGQAGTVKRSSVVKRVLRNPLGVIAVVILLIVTMIAIFADLLAPFEANYANIGKTLANPDSVNFLGTDSSGRDVWSRLAYGARITLLSALLCCGVSILIGVPAGLIAGYYSGKFDSAANWVVNVLMSLPAIIILLTVRSAFGPSVWYTMIALGVIISPSYFRLTRTAVQSVRNELYVDAARVAGLGDWSIVTRHIFSVVRAPLIIQTAMISGVAISVQSGLEFLGLGDASTPSWGAMLSEGFANVYLNPLLLVWPILAIGLTIAAFVLLGSSIRDALEDGEKVQSKKASSRRRAAERAYGSTAESARDAAASRKAGKKETAVVESGTEHHLVKVTNLGIGYPQANETVKKVVDDVSFHVDRGEVLGIVGESGSGKSQTAFSILGLLPDNARIVTGSIQIDGKYTVAPGQETVNQRELVKLRGKRIAYIPQEPMSNLDPAFTIGHQLVRPMVKVLGISRATAKARALELLGDVGIPNPQRTFDAYPYEVSGGMAQRVLIAGAISCKPDIIIADEPTTALDVTIQAEVLDLLRDLQHTLGVGIVMVTHNFGIIADLCDRVVVMQNGRLVESGEVRQILRNPTDPYTVSLLASMLEDKEPMTMLLGPDGPDTSDPDNVPADAGNSNGKREIVV